MTNEGRTITMTPYSIGDFYVFGMFEGAYFKMASVDSQGNWIENRYNTEEMTSTMTDLEREQIWAAATVSMAYGAPDGYSVSDVVIGCPHDIGTLLTFKI